MKVSFVAVPGAVHLKFHHVHRVQKRNEVAFNLRSYLYETIPLYITEITSPTPTHLSFAVVAPSLGSGV
jgi:hypothetical protein